MKSSLKRSLPDNTTVTTDIHAPGEIRFHDLSKRAAADLRLRPRGAQAAIHVYHRIALTLIPGGTIEKFMVEKLAALEQGFV